MPELLVHIILHHILGEAAFFKHILVTNISLFTKARSLRARLGYAPAQNHKLFFSSTWQQKVKHLLANRVIFPMPRVPIHTQAALHCWFNTPNTQMLKSQIVIWSLVHVLGSVQTSILLCLPTQKQGKWVPKFKHLLQMKPRRVSPSQWLTQSLKSQVTHQPFRLHLLTLCNLFLLHE